MSETQASDVLVGGAHILLADYSADLPDWDDLEAWVNSGTVPTGFYDVGGTTSNVVETRTEELLIKRDQHSGLPIDAFTRQVDMTVSFTTLAWTAQNIANWLNGSLDDEGDEDEISVGGVGRKKKFRLVLIGAAPGDDDGRTMVVYPRVFVSGDQALEWGTEDSGGEVPMEFTALKPLPADIVVNSKYATGKVIFQGDIAEPT